MLILLLCILVAWLALGYACWRVIYYAAIKDWYMLFGDDYREYNGGKNALRLWKLSAPLVIIGGLISLWCTLGDRSYKKHGAVLYFKVPKQAQMEDPMVTITNN